MSGKPETVRVPMVTISTPVVYLVNGEMNQAKSAIVHKCGDEGIVDLHQFGDYNGSTFLRRNVRHLDDPAYKINPQLLAQAGAYLTPKEYAIRKEEEIKRIQDAERQRHLGQIRMQNERIIRLASDGFTVTQIAAQVGISEGMVEEVLRGEKITPATTPKLNPAGA